MPSALDPSAQRKVRGIGPVGWVECRHSEQFPLAIQVRRNGAAVNLTGNAALESVVRGATVTVGGTGNPTGFQSPLVDLAVWQVEAETGTGGRFQIAVPDKFSSVNPAPGATELPGAFITVYLELADHSKHELVVIVYARFGSDVDATDDLTLPVAGTPTLLDWDIGANTVEAVSPTTGTDVSVSAGTFDTASYVITLTKTDGSQIPIDLSNIDTRLDALEAQTPGGTGLQNYLKSITAAGAIVPVVSGAEQTAVSLATLLDLDGKLNRSLTRFPSALPDANTTVKPGERVLRDGRLYINTAVTDQVVSYNSLLSRVKATDGDNLPFLDITATFTAKRDLSDLPSNLTDAQKTSIRTKIGAGTGDGSGDDGTTVTANPSASATDSLLTLTVGDTTFNVGKITYADTDASPIVHGVPRPLFDGHMWVNRLGQAWLSGDSVTTRPSTPSIEDRAFVNSYYTPNVDDQDSDGEFRAFANNNFLQRQTVNGNVTFTIVNWQAVWNYIAGIDNTAANRAIRDNWIDLGAFDNKDQAAEALSHHADKADNSKTFVWVNHFGADVREVTSFTDSAPVRYDARYWVGPLMTSQAVRDLITQLAPPEIRIYHGAALPAANTVADADKQKLFGLADDADSPVKTWYHLKPTPEHYGEFTADRDPDDHDDIGFEIGAWGDSPDPVNISTAYQYPGSSNHTVMRVEVTADGTIPVPVSGTDIGFYYREFGSTGQWNAYLLQPVTTGTPHYVSTQQLGRDRLVRGKRYQYAVTDTGPPGGAAKVNNPAGTEYDIHPGGVRWTSLPDSYDLTHSATDAGFGTAPAPTGGDTDLSVVQAPATVTVRSSTGNDGTIQEASSSVAGVMTAAHHDKLDGIEAGAEANVDPSLSISARGTDSLTVAVDPGTDTLVLNRATTTEAGLMGSADRSKLNGIETGATADQTGAEIVAAIPAGGIAHGKLAAAVGGHLLYQNGNPTWDAASNTITVPTARVPVANRDEIVFIMPNVGNSGSNTVQLRTQTNGANATALNLLARDGSTTHSSSELQSGWLYQAIRLGGGWFIIELEIEATRLLPTTADTGDRLVWTGSAWEVRDPVFDYDSTATYIPGDIVKITRAQHTAIATKPAGVVFAFTD